MDTVACLRFLWPQGAARYVVAASSVSDAGQERWFNKSYVSIDAAARGALKLARQGFDVFHACATYTSATKKRRDDDVATNRSIYLDLDCARPGSNKPNTYPSQAAALADLTRFLDATGLPRPNLITSSGWGVHAYWVLDRDLTKTEWNPLAHGLRNLAQQHGMKFDAQVTTTITRVLRTPGTWNYKNKTDPKQAQVLACTNTYISLADVAGMLALHAGPVSATPTVQRFATSANSLNADLTAGVLNRPAKMEWIVRQCPALAKMALSGSAPNSGCESRELWLAMLGLAAFTEDGHLLVNFMSRNHHAYDPTELARQWDYTCQKKAAGQVGPGTCATIAGPGGQAAICANCPHNGLITSPIVLGYGPPGQPPAAPAADPRDATTVPPTGSRLPTGHPSAGAAGPSPAPPAPFTFATDTYYGPCKKDDDYVTEPVMLGEITRIERGRGDDGRVVLITHYRASSQDRGAVVHVPIAALGQRADVALTSLGFRVAFGKYREANQMFKSWSDLLAANAQGSVADVSHYGWHEGDGQPYFVVGDRIYRANGAVEVSMTPLGTARIYQPKGSLAAWQQAAQAHLDVFHPALQAMLAGSFAAPLVHLSARPGGRLLSISGPATGVGKTTASDVAQSVWGDPVGGTVRMNATVNAVPEFAGQLKSLPVFWDEARGVEPQAFMNLMFSIVEGRGRMRLNSSAEMRETASWNNMVVVSSNMSVRDRAAVTEAVSGEGPQRARVFECHVHQPARTRPDLHLLTAECVNNRGHAGDAYARFLVQHRDMITRQLTQLEIGLVQMLQAPAAARFHVSTMALLIMGASLATAAGILRFDVVRLRDYLISVYQHMLGGDLQPAEQQQQQPADLREGFAIRVVEEFLSKHSGQVLVTNSAPPAKGRPTQIRVSKPPARQGAEPVLVQIALQQNAILIDEQAFRLWLVQTNRASDEVMDLLRRYFGAVRQRRALGAGTNFSRLRVNCLVLPPTHPEIAELVKSFGEQLPDYVPPDPAALQAPQPMAPTSPYLH